MKKMKKAKSRKKKIEKMTKLQKLEAGILKEGRIALKETIKSMDKRTTISSWGIDAVDHKVLVIITDKTTPKKIFVDYVKDNFEAF